jgi:hypothetical protein
MLHQHVEPRLDFRGMQASYTFPVGYVNVVLRIASPILLLIVVRGQRHHDVLVSSFLFLLVFSTKTDLRHRYASPNGYERRANGTVASAVVREDVPETVHVEHAGQALPPAHFVPVSTREGEAAKPASNATTNATTAAVPQSHKAARHRLQRSRLDSSN